MVRFILKRAAYSLPIVAIVPFLVFVLVDLTPGDAAVAIAGQSATLQEVETIRTELGLDDPLLERFGRWAGDAISGDLGSSTVTGESVSTVIRRALPVTVSLGLTSLALTVIGGVSLGVLAAARQGGRIDRLVAMGSSLAVAVPGFWLGLMLVVVFAIELEVLPSGGYVAFGDDPLEWGRHIVMPALAMSTFSLASVVLQTRAAMIDEMAKDYVVTARAKGAGPVTVLVGHALKNACVPIATVLGFRLGQLFAGSAIIEAVFGLHGVGSVMIRASAGQDVPLLLGLVLVATVLIVGANLLVDMSYGYFNPRVRVGAGTG